MELTIMWQHVQQWVQNITSLAKRTVKSYKGRLHHRSTIVYRVFQRKVAPPPKTFRNIFNSIRPKSFCLKFCKCVCNAYPHVSTNFCRFILIFHQMALFFPRVLLVFTLSSCKTIFSPVCPTKLLKNFVNTLIAIKSDSYCIIFIFWVNRYSPSLCSALPYGRFPC